MTTEYKYDVFISYSRKDYVDENTKEVVDGNVISVILKTFKDNCISFWIDEKGDLTGKKFAQIIAKHIRESMVFLFVCSKNSVASKWVDRELSVADELNKHIIPFICDDSFKDDKVIMFTTSLDRIEYAKNPQKELDKLVKAIQTDKKELEEKKRIEEEQLKKKLQEEEEKKRKLEAEKRKKETLNEIKRLSAEHQFHSLQQNVILQQLIEKNNSIGIMTKSCPVCMSISSIGATYCDRCGFLFPPLYAIDGNDSYAFDDRLSIYQSNHNTLRALTAENERLTNTRLKLEASLHEAEKNCMDYQRTIEEIKSLIAKKDVQIEELRASSTQASEYYLNQAIQLEEEKKELLDRLKEKEEELNKLKGQLLQKVDEIMQLKKTQEASVFKINTLEKMIAENEALSESQYSFDVILLNAGEQKLDVTNLIQEITGSGLKEAKRFIESVPIPIKQGVNTEEANKLWDLLESAGASVSFVPHRNHSSNPTKSKTYHFHSKKDVFNFIKSYSYLSSSLKLSDQLYTITDLNQMLNDLANLYKIDIHISNPKKYSINDLITLIWDLAKTK